MTRLLTNGFETQKLSTDAARDPEGQSCSISGNVAISTAFVRSGAASAACTSGSIKVITAGITTVLGRTYYSRQAHRFTDVTPTNALRFMAVLAGAQYICYLELGVNGTVTLRDGSGNALGAVAVPSANTWYVFEIKWRVSASGDDSFEVRVDGEPKMSPTVVTAASENFAADQLQGGQITDSGSCNVNTDDWGLNDDQGAANNSWCDMGKIALLKALSDSAKSPTGASGWVGGAGGQTNLFGGVDNLPPVGVAVGASSTDATQIEDDDNSSTDTYDAQLAAFTDSVASGGAGMDSDDLVVHARTLARGGNSTTTSRTMEVEGISNPVVAAITQASGTTAAGTDPTGWTTFGRNFALPGPTLGTGPVVRVRKGSASTNAMTFDLIGLVVEYMPRTFVTASDSGAGTESASLTAEASGTDSGAGTDTSELTAELTGTESDSGTDASSLAASIEGTDSAAGDEASDLSEISHLVGSDSGTGGDDSALEVALPSSEAGVGSEAGSTAVAATGADAGVLSEVAELAQLLDLTGSDGGSCAEVAVVTVLVSGADAGVGAEASDRGIFVLSSDSGVFSEVASRRILSTLPFSPGGGGAEVASGDATADYDRGRTRVVQTR